MTNWNKKQILNENINQNEIIHNELQTEENQALWLQVALEEYATQGDFNAFYQSLERVVHARKISVRKMAKDLKLSRTNIIKLLDGDCKTAPRLDTLTRILSYLDFELSITPKKKII